MSLVEILTTLDGDEVRFEPDGRKYRCSICGRRGYLGSGQPSVDDLPPPWYVKCLTGHPLTCAMCGRRFVNALALSGHLSPRRPDSRPSPCRSDGGAA